MMKRLAAEFLGTFWLVLGGCGTAVFAAGVPDLGVGYAGVALAFGLTVLTGVYALGHVSGGHFNPAVSFGLAAGNRFDWKDVPGYVVAQVIGGVAAAAATQIPAGHSSDHARTACAAAVIRRRAVSVFVVEAGRAR